MRLTIQEKKKNKSIFLFGPTASGKTSLVEDFFSSGYEIINADSVQVYKHLDIGSAKPSKLLMSKITHHLVDIKEPYEQFTVGEFIKRADEAATLIYQNGNIPLVTGGTAFYFKHYLYGLSEAPIADLSIREKVNQMLRESGKEYLHSLLLKVDPESGNRINVNDEYRVTRALEVYYQTGKPLSSFKIPTEIRLSHEPLIIALERDRDELYSRINERVEIMFKSGLVDEVKGLISSGANLSWPSMGAIGYREFLEAESLNNETLLDIKEKIKQNSRRYAKRQITFFKSFKGVNFIHPDDKEGLKKLLDEYLSS